jgi:PUA domain protein
MTELHLRKRHRLRQKEIASLSSRIDDVLGTKSFGPSDTVDMAEGPDFDVIFVDGKILGFLPGGEPFLTVRGLLRYVATKRFVTVDMGAVRFVYNGADVMGPGIVASDGGIKEGDLVWVRDEKNLRPLSVGRALVDSAALGRKEKGKAVSAVHHVGDKLWLLDEQDPKQKPRDDETRADDEA